MSAKTRIQFGKHKGMLWGDIPESYLEWLVREFKERSKTWRLALAELQKRQDERAGYKSDSLKPLQKPHSARSKHKKRHKAHAPHVHTGANWKPPEASALSEEERMRMFEEIVDTSQGTVHNVERWANVIPSLSKKSSSRPSHPARIWDDYEDYCALERGLTDILRRNEE